VTNTGLGIAGMLDSALRQKAGFIALPLHRYRHNPAAADWQGGMMDAMAVVSVAGN